MLIIQVLADIKNQKLKKLFSHLILSKFHLSFIMFRFNSAANQFKFLQKSNKKHRNVFDLSVRQREKYLTPSQEKILRNHLMRKNISKFLITLYKK